MRHSAHLKLGNDDGELLLLVSSVNRTAQLGSYPRGGPSQSNAHPSHVANAPMRIGLGCQTENRTQGLVVSGTRYRPNIWIFLKFTC